jgi:CelD/BcsL family acetyltransferase involved in cellulose biosynthesis
MRLDVVTDEPGFLALREEWNALLGMSRANTIFLTWEWAHTWWRHLSGGAALRLVVVRSGREVVAIAPWLVRDRDVLRLELIPTLQFLGTGSAGADYLDVIVKPDVEAEALAALASYVAQQPWQADFSAMQPGARARFLAAGLAERGWRPAVRTSDVCPFIPMAGRTWEMYLGALGREHRYNFRRRLNRLQRDHAMQLERASTDEQRAVALEQLVRLHNERWAGRGGSTAFHTRALIEFHREFSTLALANGWLRLFTLRADDTPAAALYGLAYGGTFSFYQAGFDARFSPMSVGLVTMGLAIQSAFGEGLAEYDFLHGAEAYKALWTRDTRPIQRLDLYPPRIRGAVSHFAAQAVRRARRAARQLLSAGRRYAGPRTHEVSGVRPAVVVPSAR